MPPPESAGGKGHRKPKAGRKAEKRKTADQKKKGVHEEAQASKGAGKNPRAFSFQSAIKAKAQRSRSAEKEQRRLHAPMMEKAVEEPPPMVVLVHGPPGVGKSTLIKCMVKHFTQQNLSEVLGPITVVAGKKRRVTFVECPSDLNGMIDAAKYADLVLLLIDGSFGFEMETFEFLNLLQVHGFPKVMGVLTHLDGFTDQKRLKKTKKKLKARFWTEIYDGAKLFYLSGIQHGKYLKREVFNLARFISVMKLRPLTWRLAHPYALIDRFEDITPRETVRLSPKCDREVTVYGYLRGANLRPGARVHIAGVGDYTIQELDALTDPCPLPETVKKRGLNERERLLYAPMADVGGLLYDNDAVYIDIPDWKVQYTGEGGVEGTEGDAMVRELQRVQEPVDEKLSRSQMQLFNRGGMMRPDDAGSSTDEEDEEDEDGEDGEDEEESDDDGEEEDGGGYAALPRGMPKGVVGVDGEGGRLRRRAMFEDEDTVEVQRGSDDEEEEEEEEGEEAVDDEAEGEEESDDEGLGAAATWKKGMEERMSALFSSRATDLFAFVYGRPPSAASGGAGRQLGDDDDDDDGGGSRGGNRGRGGGGDDDGDSDDDDLFRPVKRKSEAEAANDLEAVDALDSARTAISTALLAAWEGRGAVEALRNRFVTGDWEEGRKRAEATPGEEDDEDGAGEGEDEDVYGDFEDMETGEVVKGSALLARGEGKPDAVTAAAQKAILEATREENRISKAAKKAAFDASYDRGSLKGSEKKVKKGGASEGDEEEEGAEGALGGDRPSGKAKKPGDDKEETYYDAVKRDMAERQGRTKAMLDALDAQTRLAMEGIRPGSYVRIRLTGVPCELVQFLDPCTPLLLGGLGQSEEKMGLMRLRIKRHRWFPKVLKTRDPLVLSVGWRRFQSLPVFAVEDHNRRLRSLKYTPEHMHCVAAVYGPMAPPNTGVVAVQNIGASVRGWRISATGVVLELDAQFRVMKKLKLIGTPFKVHRHTAFISGMFTSQLEAAKFEGASIRTVSGIRGTIKKAVKTGGMQGVKEGTFRASFEDKILSSDIVFLRAWVAVDIPRLFNPVTNLLTQREKPRPQLTGAEKRGRFGSGKGDGRKAAEAEDVGPAPSTAALTAGGDLSSLLALPLSAALSDGAIEGADGAAGGLLEFQASPRFTGSRPGYIFKLGQLGQGYYRDHGPKVSVVRALAAAKAAAEAAATAAAAAPRLGSGDATAVLTGASVPGGGWLPMRTVAQLRRDGGTGAPRNPDSLYRPIERAPRKFNPLKIPLALQAALPYKTKPKLEPKRHSKTLEQKRAVVLEPHERKAYTLVQQLNAIRNDKMKKRNEMNDRRRQERAKKQAKSDEWRADFNKAERKKRYIEAGQAEKRKAMKAAGGGKYSKKARKDGD